MSSRVLQLTEELGFPPNSEEAFFAQSFNEEGDFEYGIVCSVSQDQQFCEEILLLTADLL